MSDTGDYISREAALASMLDFADFYCDETQGAAECVMEYISAIPAADVRPVVRSEWVHLGGDEWWCKNCGHVISTEGSWEHPLSDKELFFCEKCGADMRKEGNNDTDGREDRRA